MVTDKTSPDPSTIAYNTMKTVNVPVTTLESLIEGLQSAVNVCYNVDSTDGNCERTYPYATGYSRGAMEMAISNLEYLKSQAK